MGSLTGLNPDWEGMVIPVVCPVVPSDMHLEVNIRDGFSLPRTWNEQMGRVKVPIASFQESALTEKWAEQKLSAQGGQDFTITLKSKWCSDWTCVERFLTEAQDSKHAG